MRNPTTLLKSASLKLTALFYLMGLLVLPSTAAAWNYQLHYRVPADAGVDEYRIYLELGSSGYQFYTQIQGPLAPFVAHVYDLVGLPDDQDVSIVMTSCRFDDGVPVESVHSNELFFPVDPACVDADCDDGNPCTLDYCLNDACSYDAAAMDGQFCDDGDAGNDPDSCSDGICTGTPVTPFGVTALSGISDGATVSGELYIEALVSAGTESVRFYLDGAEYHVESWPPYGFTGDDGVSPNAWNTADVANGLHNISATGYDQDGAAGQAGTSVTVSFNVQNATPECIDDADCADGDLCNGDEWCDLGACRPGTALTCLDPGQCQTASCDALLGCVAYALANGTSCDDADAGTHSDICIFGSCAGTPAECLSNGDCSDGNVCNGDEYCSNYTCLSSPALSCPDPGQCQVASCDAALGCVTQNVADGTSCDDGDPGTFDDTCQSGTCVGVVPPPLQVTGLTTSLPDGQPVGTPVTYTAVTTGGSGTLEYRWWVGYGPEGSRTWYVASDGWVAISSFTWTEHSAGIFRISVHVRNVGSQDYLPYGQDFTATEPPPVECTTDDDCANGDLCDGDEWCNNGACLPGTALSCPDPGQCQTASCDSSLGCVTQNLDNGTSCDDADPHTYADICSSGSCAGTPVECIEDQDCSDGVDCTVDVCSQATHSCLNMLDHGHCDNGLFCDGAETCDALLDCQSGTPIDCTDGVGCTIDSCNETTNSCDNVTEDSSCPDPGQCQTASCDATFGCVTQNVANGTSCDDGDPGTHGDVCTSGSCAGVPVECTIDAHCSDGNLCNGIERCSNGTCRPGTAPVCGDVNVGQCRIASCDPQLGCGIEALPDGAACDDGNPTTPDDACNLGLCAGLRVTGFTTNLPNGQPVGTPVTYTAITTGASGPLEYMWWVGYGPEGDRDWYLVSGGWVSGSSFTWTEDNVGTFRVSAHVRNVGSQDYAPYGRDFIATENAGPQITGFTTSLPDGQPAGTPVTYTTITTGGSGPLEYRWWIGYGPEGNRDWYLVSDDWVSSSSFTWTEDNVGTFRVSAHVRNVGSQDYMPYGRDFEATDQEPAPPPIP